MSRDVLIPVLFHLVGDYGSADVSGLYPDNDST